MTKLKNTLDAPVEQSPWNDYCRRRRLLRLGLVGFLPVGGLGAFLDWQFGLAFITLVVICLWVILIPIATERMGLFPCPRCGKTFFRDGYAQSFLVKYCMHCDLPKWADPPFIFTPAVSIHGNNQTHSTQLPSQDEINLYKTLEEQSAVEHFHGKNIEEAELLFRDNFLQYQEDLMWMGPKAFRFYLPAAVNYLLGPHSDGDSDGASSFCKLIEFCLAEQPEKLDERTVGIVKNAAAEILKNYGRYKCNPAIYVDLPKRYQVILSQFK